MIRSRLPRVSWRTRLIIIAVTAGLVAAGLLIVQRHDIRRSLERASLPEAVNYEQVKEGSALPTSDVTTPPTTSEKTPAPRSPQGEVGLPPETNLAVPFTAQAPHGIWEPPYKEFCEEASVLMAASYLQGEDIPNADYADQKLLEIKAFTDALGYPEDTTAAETAVILREYFNIQDVQLLPNPTVTDIKEAVAAGKLVIVPAAGRLLGNPYYTPPGPLYHMFVVKGYTADGKFITNDPGTRRGADFLYTEATIMNAMHDWRADKDIEKGAKVILIVG